MEDKKLQELSENDLKTVVGGVLGSIQHKEFMRCDDAQSATAYLRKSGIFPGTAPYNRHMAEWASQH